MVKSPLEFAVIEARNLECPLSAGRSVRFGHLRIPERGIGLVHGDNGTGKTTLVRCLAGIRMDWSGSVSIDGRPLRDMTRREIAGVLSYLPQTAPLDVSTSVEDYVRQGLYAARADRWDEVIHALELGKYLRRDFSRLSGGEKQLVRIARALCPAVKYTLLDEPETYLSRANRSRFDRLIRRLAAARGVAIVTHAPVKPSGYRTILELKPDASGSAG